MTDKKYWEEFYRNYRNNSEPSSFATYVGKKYLIEQKTLLELGCGNGRDALFFASTKQINVTAIDQAVEEIQYLQSVSTLNPTFVEGDFTELSAHKSYDYLYSRFTLHSIKEEEEDRLFSQLYNKINPKGLLLIEARTKKDENQAKYFSASHYRRYLDFDKTVKKIEEQGFEIIEKIESQGLAVYKSEDPFVLRIIAKRK